MIKNFYKGAFVTDKGELIIILNTGRLTIDEIFNNKTLFDSTLNANISYKVVQIIRK